MNKDDKRKTHISICGKSNGGGSDAGAVRFDEAQTLTSAEQLQARQNIGVPTEWFGTQAEYDLIDPKDPNTVYHIEGGQPVQSNWNEADSTSLAYIQNKPTIPAMTIQELTFTLEGGVKKTVEFYTAPNYFYVEDISGSDNTLSITKNNSSAPDIEVFCSTDRSNWTSMGTTSTTAITATIPVNGKLYLKATANQWGSSNIITANRNHNVGGNIMSLLYGDNFEGQTTFQRDSAKTFESLFSNNTTLINANRLIMPATALSYACYRGMFQGCTALTTAPAILPATSLGDYCYGGMFINCTSLTTTPVLTAATSRGGYQYMFQGCTSLTTAPALPATTLAEGCYYYMFRGCSALTTAPALPATTMAKQCYSNMFQGCTSLTTAPALPATTLAQSCYDSMFQGCTNLNKVTTYAQDISAANSLNNWLNNTSATGDFYNLGGATYTSGASGIPTGWTEHTSL